MFSVLTPTRLIVRGLVACASLGLLAIGTSALQSDVISREVSVRVSPPGPLDVLSREVSVRVSPPGPLDVISREVSVGVAIPDLVAESLSLDPIALNPGSYVSVHFLVSCSQGDALPSWNDMVLLTSDLEVGNEDDIPLLTLSHTTALGPGDQYAVSADVWIPVDVEGAYYFALNTDSGSAVPEGDLEDNNTHFQGPFSAMPFAGVVLSGGDYVGPEDPSLDGQPVVVQNGTVTIDGTHDVASLVVGQGAFLTHTAGYEGGLEFRVAGDAVVGFDSAIDVTGKGYAPEQGPGIGVSVYGGSLVGFTRYGGGHGGFGGNEQVGVFDHYGHGYGSILAPRTLGSGGRHDTPNLASGGGAVALDVGGTLTLEGDVRADGMPLTYTGNGGGGAGGSVWVQASVLEGAGALRARGGFGKLDGAFIGGGGGGGGRVHVAFDDASGYSGSVIAYGGPGDSHGGAGTIVTEDRTAGTRDLTVRNFQPGPLSAEQLLLWAPTRLPEWNDFDSIVIDDGVVLWTERSRYGVRLQNTGDLVLGPGAGVLAFGTGFGGSEGPGASGEFHAGGGHGGQGGIGNGSGPAGAPYDSEALPQLPGSGRPLAPTHGGGAVLLQAAGDLVFDGTIDARGDVGGGAGGSALLIGDTVSGAGSIDASGSDSTYFVICGVQQGAGGGGRVALHAREPGGLVGYVGTSDVSNGSNQFLCTAVNAMPGTVHTEDGSVASVAPLELIGPIEDFDHLSAGSAPDAVASDESGSWNLAGAWGFPPTYDSFAYEAGTDEGGIRLVDTASFDGSTPGVSRSLALRETPAGLSGLFLSLFTTGVWDESVGPWPGQRLGVEASVYVDSSVGGGGIFSVGYGHGELSGSSLAPIEDLGPTIEWLDNGDLVAHLAGMGSTQKLITTSFDTWQRVRMEIDLDQDTYDLWLSESGQPFVKVGSGLPFVTPQQRLDRYVIGQTEEARAIYDDLTRELIPVATQPLSVDVEVVSLFEGGTQNLFLDSGPAQAGVTYGILGTLSGTVPGFPLGGVPIPLNPDSYFLWTVQNPFGPPTSNFFGVLDGDGKATAQMNLAAGSPAPWAGLTFHHAYILLTPTSSVSFASNPVPLHLVP